MKPAACTEFFARLRQANPSPRSDLEYTNPYTLLVAVVLSAQATDAGVNRATRPLFARIQTPAQMLEFGTDNLLQAIRSIGLYRTKGHNIIALSRLLLERHDAQVPADLEALMALPGVGRKTANVVLNIIHGQPTIAVDTHVFRVANRTGLARGTTPAAVEAKLLQVVPSDFRQHAHHWLILHGRYVCKARAPACASCVVADLCAYNRRRLSKRD